MAYTTAQLITKSYYASQIVAREFETVSGAQLSDGLEFLNDILTEKVVDNAMIPYETTYTGEFQENVKEYTIENLIQINTLTFYLNNVRYSLTYDQRNHFFGSPRVENVNSLPFEWYFERQFGGGKLYIYFAPNQDYPFEIHGIFRLSEVTKFQDLSLTLDRFYISYLHFALTDRLCAEFGYETPANITRQLAKYEAWIANKSRIIDLRMQKVSTLTSTPGISWAFVNLGDGWTVPY